MAESWEPANALEQQLSDAMESGDQDRYFQVLGGTDLLLPLPVDDRGAPTGGWATWLYEGRTYLLAFTSREAMSAALAQHAGQFRTAKLTDIAATWPDPTWWLAIDFGLPIAGYLPENFVSQITGVSAGAAGQQISANPAPAPAAAPADSSGAAPPADGSAWAPADQRPADQPAANGGAGRPNAAGFQPANDAEQALLTAAAANDRKAFMDALLAAYTLIPVPATSISQSVTDPAFPWPRVERDGRMQVPVFTSPERMTERVGDSGYTVAPFVHVVESWPDRSLWLTLNPDTPIGATLEGNRIFELADWTRQTQLAERLGVQAGPAATAEGASWAPTADATPDTPPGTAGSDPAAETAGAGATTPEPAAGPVPGAPTHGDTASAGGYGDTASVGAYGDAAPSGDPADGHTGSAGTASTGDGAPAGDAGSAGNLDAGNAASDGTGHVPTTAEATTGHDATTGDSGSGGAATSEGGPGDATSTGDHHDVEAPAAGAVSEGADTGASAAHTGGVADEVGSPSADAPSVGTSIGDAGTGDAGTGDAGTAGHAGTGAADGGSEGVVARAAVPVAEADTPAAGQGDVEDHPEWPPVPAPEGEPESVPGPVPDLTFPADLQKPLPDEQVAYYLERHFDRVGGHVHRVADGPVRADDLRTASAIGGESGVPVHAIRWHVEAARLLPLLGAARAEPDPELVEYRIATTRLPHGAELYRIGTDGTTNVLAIFNADQHRWHLL